MDYKVLKEKFFSGTTTREEEDALRRYLKGDNLPQEAAEDKEMLLAMLQQPGTVGQILRRMGMEPELTRSLIQVLYGEGSPEMPLPQGLTFQLAKVLS